VTKGDDRDALDELERVDRAIGARLAEYNATRPSSAVTAAGQATPDTIRDTALHGAVGKNLVEQLALREAALRLVTDHLAGDERVADLAARLNHSAACDLRSLPRFPLRRSRTGFRRRGRNG
jgi:hypothetical protein